ncbi:hypothetical protein BCR24_09540 [Enterococcus ureilyticus]|uniref:WxL domain-containing protein n=1 Tax=Enterococcus ureilyticus TaxID=1131292 RepID=A0A1E5H5E5_9ENTE|nr:WxL domain-containing protein [Enterococcus ureilyticus]MBM7689049.1 hypothetical protein [Enterococcus ureilyticus]MBO0446170.1 WxL domain-containing protein [Enterococcus ureilyticus]OEG20154.1 hypothetical protein BCR24_09540 [Enterococcus ureilyticus]
MKTIKLTVLTATLFSTVLLGTTAFAEETVPPENPEAVNKDIDRTAKFILEPGSDDNGPVDPIVPINPPTNQKGNLTIDAVSNFDFGKKKIDKVTSTYDAVVAEGEVLGAQVTDVRGTGAGWNLTAKISTFENAEKTRVLKGAEVTIPTGKVSTNSVDDTKPAIASGLTLNEEPATIFSAAVDNGMGTWANEFEGLGEKVQLKVPTGNYADTYTAEITWSLADAPK